MNTRASCIRFKPALAGFDGPQPIQNSVRALIGFAARVQASGARTFTIDYRHAGRQRRMTIGRWPEWSVTAARERAKELRRAIDEGNDPLATKEEFRGAPRIRLMNARLSDDIGFCL